ncbi:hypothetical protein LWF15_24760 [Kineosporia rhizophila]|nr:hypothetical protein [Kineosporia rhizophila]MCE0538714.1 hypothetical protein [Kineosporia rhizophila]
MIRSTAASVRYPAAMLPVAAAMPEPATTPRVWATARAPPTVPRSCTGTWSGTVAVIAASMAFRPAWASAQARTICPTLSA